MFRRAVKFYVRRMRYNYYMKNLIERNKNRDLLSKVRANDKKEINNKNHLVSVTIPTYNRADLLLERAIPSVLRQTYNNFEIIIVGNCTDDTEQRVTELNDKRIKFLNLSARGRLPADPYDRWLASGSVARNKSLELCTGDWIAPLDDDDEFSDDHIKVLLNHAIENNLEMVYGKVKMEILPDKWIDLGSYPLRRGH